MYVNVYIYIHLHPYVHIYPCLTDTKYVYSHTNLISQNAFVMLPELCICSQPLVAIYLEKSR